MSWKYVVFLMVFSTITAGAESDVALEAKQIPGLAYLINHLSELALTDSQKSGIQSLIAPSSHRVYYQKTASYLDPKRREALVDYYSELLHIPKSQVILYAVTNAELGRTILFPEFLSLKTEASQAALLLHEALWLWSRKLSYADVVDIERAALAIFQHPRDADVYLKFYTLWGRLYPHEERLSILWRASLVYDGQSFPMKVRAKDLFGTGFLKCWRESPNPMAVCHVHLIAHLTEKGVDRPSLFRRALLEYVLSRGVLQMPPLPENLEDIDVRIQEAPVTKQVGFTLTRGVQMLGSISFPLAEQNRVLYEPPAH